MASAASKRYRILPIVEMSCVRLPVTCCDCELSFNRWLLPKIIAITGREGVSYATRMHIDTSISVFETNFLIF